jgi:hypothetical protein
MSLWQAQSENGSPPRAGTKLTNCFSHISMLRITPARGQNGLQLTTNYNNAGSPPRAGTTPVTLHADSDIAQITPRAGTKQTDPKR